MDIAIGAVLLMQACINNECVTLPKGDFYGDAAQPTCELVRDVLNDQRPRNMHGLTYGCFDPENPLVLKAKATHVKPEKK